MSRNIQELISDFCRPILVKGDHLDITESSRYIDTLENEEKERLYQYSSMEHRQEIRSIVYAMINGYISTYKPGDTGLPFSFDSASGSGFKEYRIEFVKLLKKESNGADPPKAVEYAFDCIQEASESYRLFENLNKIQMSNITKLVDAAVQPLINQASTDLKKSAEAATKNAVRSAKIQAKRNAKEAAQLATQETQKIAATAEAQAELAAQKAEEAVGVEVQKKMGEVSAKVSETSVVILGMFAAIVLSAVTGLFYSSSVMANISADNFVELIAGASVAGLVGLNIIVVMFFFIEKFRETPSSPTWLRTLIICIDAFLALVFLAAVVGHFVLPMLSCQPDLSPPQ